MMGATTLGSPDNKGLNGTKKTITDFFAKSPQNSPTVESKPKDLLGYFFKPSCDKLNNLVEECSQLDSSPKSHKKITPISNSANSVDSKNKKRKLNGKQEVSNNNSVEECNVKPKRQKSDKDSLPQITEKSLFPKVLTDGNPTDENCKEKAVADGKEASAKKVRGKSVRRSLAKPKCPEGKKKIFELSKPIEICVSGEIPKDESSSDPCEIDNNNIDCDENVDAQNLELSYEEYLMTQETEPEDLEADAEQTEENPESTISESSQKVTKPVSIANFFSQVQKPPKKENSDSQKVTIQADIHPEPRQKLSPEKKPSGSKSGEIVLKTISRDTKSKLEEQDCIVVLDSEPPSDIKEVLPSDRTKPKSSKKASSSGSKKSAGKNKDSSSASDAKDGKPSQSLLNFGGHKPLKPKPQDEATAVQNTNSSQSTLTFLKENSKNQSDVVVKKPEEELAVEETLPTNASKKRKRGRNAKEKIAPTPKENIVLVEQEEISEKGIVDANVETPISVEKEENNAIEIISGEQDKTESSGKEVNNNNNTEDKESPSNKCPLESNEKTPVADKNADTTPGTRRSARIRDRKTSSPPSAEEEMQCEPVTPKLRKEKRKSESGLSEKSKENTTGKGSKTKQADPGKSLAPIFLKKKEKEKENVVVIDPEILKLRRAFLMSGLTEEAKRQQQQQKQINALSTVAMDYPPIPSETHIQQKPSPEEDGNTQGSNLDVWNLPQVLLPGLSGSGATSEDLSLETPKWSCPSSLLRTHEDKDKDIKPQSDKTFSGHRSLSESEVNATIKILSEANPSYPVQRFYEMAKTKSKSNLKTDGENTKPKEKPEVTVPAPEEPKGRGVTRRSLGRRRSKQKATNEEKSEENTKKEKGDKIDCPPEDKGCDILWTEKYQPQHSVEVISNCNNLKKLKSWLLEWKQQTDREIRKLKKMLQKQRKNKKSKGEDTSSSCSWMDDDSNFEMSTSESDDDSLCNTMLLTGPHGIGKTSSIYALATELGYQVFEVNASSSRSGKKILMQLQEATQSHQVSKDKSERTTPINVGLPNNLNNQIKETSKTSVKKTGPTSFANFFKSSNSGKVDPVGDSEKVKPETAGGKKKQAASTRTKGESKASKTSSSTLKPAPKPCKPDLSDTGSNCTLDTASDKMRKRVNISSTSLILFDEVDVVLEEDKGFWSAIQSFMQTTKRPIILTASSADIAEQFGSGCCEHLSFRSPSTKVITSHLQTLCLAESVVTESQEISSLVEYFNGNMRACLLNLQFWINSGGDLNKHKIPIDSKRNEVALSSASGTDSPKDTILSHRHCLESCLGLNPNNLKSFFNDDLIKPSSDAISLEDLTSVCYHGYQRHSSLLHQLFTSKLPLPRKPFPPLPNRVQLLLKQNKAKKTATGFSRILSLDSELYDSEASLDEPVFLTLAKPKEKEDKMETDSQPISCSQESETNNSASQFAATPTESVPTEEITYPEPSLSELSPQDICRQKNCENKILSCMAKFYECSSYNDVYMKSFGYAAPGGYSNRSTLSAGLWDELPMEFNTSTQSLHLCLESSLDVAANLELRSYVNCLQDISEAAEKVVAGHEHSISIAPQQECSGLVNLQSCDQSRSLTQQRAVENVLSNIPLSYGSQPNSLYLDYLPMLRDVSRAEKMRQLAKVKRRFFHYFDNIGFPLRESTLNVLVNGFT